MRVVFSGGPVDGKEMVVRHAPLDMYFPVPPPAYISHVEGDETAPPRYYHYYLSNGVYHFVDPESVESP